MSRHLIVVDVETNGLDLNLHQVVEVAWWNLNTDARGYFIPAHNVRQVLHDADIKALQVNRYIDRIPFEAFDGRWLDRLDELCAQLMGNDDAGATLAGSNPAFDAAMLTKLIRHTNSQSLPGQYQDYEFDEAPWHHRLWDLSAYAAGVLGLDELPGLAKVCELLGIEPGDHTAEADVTATGLCFRALMAKAGAR